MSGVKVFDGSWVFDLIDREDPVEDGTFDDCLIWEDPVEGGIPDDCLICLSILSLKQDKWLKNIN